MIKRVDIGHMQNYNLRDKLEIKRRYTGSCQGMRFLIRPAGESKDDAEFEAFTFPEPYNFEHTAENKKTRKTFPYSEEGLDQIHQWLNEQYEERKEYWTAAMKAGLMVDEEV